MQKQEINEKGIAIFYYPEYLLSYDVIVEKALLGNTFRGFHRIDRSKPGASKTYRELFKVEKQNIIKYLKNVKSENELHEFSNEICKKLKFKLKRNINNDQLNSYNKIRKPVDIMIEHLVAIGEDFKKQRKKIAKLLFLPLDSQMFSSDYVFDDKFLDDLEIKRNFTFKDIKKEDDYKEIQKYLIKRAKELNLDSRIFFDLVWNNRYKSNGKNLLCTNVKQSAKKKNICKK